MEKNFMPFTMHRHYTKDDIYNICVNEKLITLQQKKITMKTKVQKIKVNTFICNRVTLQQLANS